ncbi:hypothetical protein JQC92_16180, partial [Shewanella sp. 202IG2-18]|uniref:hypothetical protein n=1 Tax=Parashewanella hymeniacidonis TaxID=2807618 RepID=UPI001960ECC2
MLLFELQKVAKIDSKIYFKRQISFIYPYGLSPIYKALVFEKTGFIAVIYSAYLSRNLSCSLDGIRLY